MVLLGGVFQLSEALAEPAKDPAQAYVELAEKEFFRFENPNRLDVVTHLLDQMEKSFPNHPYLHWARARVSFWEKEGLYLEEQRGKKEDFLKIKNDLGKKCHAHVDQCIKVAPENAECFLLKGACYAMQASTWGQTWKTLRVLRPMMLALEKAQELPSSFHHRGTLTTNQLATIMQAALYRIMPDSFWFWIFARVRGDKTKSRALMKQAVRGDLLKEPMMLMELASSLICYGVVEEHQDSIDEGVHVLEDGLKLPIRNAMDKLDHKNMKYLIRHPDEACDYRRERFEKISKNTLDQAVKKKDEN